MPEPLIKLGPDGQKRITAADLRRVSLADIAFFAVQLLGLIVAALIIADAI